MGSFCFFYIQIWVLSVIYMFKGKFDWKICKYLYLAKTCEEWLFDLSIFVFLIRETIMRSMA